MVDADSAPTEQRGLVSIFLSTWVVKYIHQGFQKELTKDQMPPLDQRFDSSHSTKKAFELWDEQVSRYEKALLSKEGEEEGQKEETGKAPPSPPSPSIIRLAWQLEKRWLCVGLVFGTIQGFLSACARPILLNHLILAYQPDSEDSVQKAMFLLIGFSCVILLEGYAKVVSINLISSDAGTSILSWLIPLLHRKATRLRRVPATVSEPTDSTTVSLESPSTNEQQQQKSKKKQKQQPQNDEESSVGSNTTNASLTSKGEKKNKNDAGAAESNEIALIGNDILGRFEDFKFAAILPQGVVGMISGIGTLVYLLGRPSVIAFATMFASLVVGFAFAVMSRRVTKLDLKAADARLSVMREVVMSIAPVKFMCWEEKYLHLLDEKRNEECKWILRFRLVLVASINMGRVSPVLTAAFTFTYMGLNGYDLSPNIIFAALAAFNALRLPLIALPMIFTQVAVLGVSSGRISKYLLQPEFEKPNSITTANNDDNKNFKQLDTTTNNNKKKKVEQKPSTQISSPASNTVEGENQQENDGRNIVAVCEKASFSWGGSAPTIVQDIDISILGGQLVAVVGRVGSGKTTLISGMIGEANLASGSVRVTQDLGYVPQKPFVLSGTVRDNILMGREYDANLFNTAIKAAAFESDLQTMTDGPESEIGEGGTTLSGGQKQRLAIARAIYSNPTLLVVDDALAAVDGRVAATIFENIFEERRRRRIGGNKNDDEGGLRATICTLNQTSFLPKFDTIVYLKKDNIVVQGTYEELMDSDPDFAVFASCSAGGGGDVDALVDDAEAKKGPDNSTTINKTKQNSGAGATDDNNCDQRDGIKIDTSNGAIEMQQVTKATDEAITVKEEEQQQQHEQGQEDDNKVKKEPSKKLVEEDTRHSGSISSKSVHYYLKMAGGWMWPLSVLCIGITAYGLMAVTDLWIAAWVSPENTRSPTYRSMIYIALSVAQACAVMAVSAVNACATNRASKKMHHNSVRKLLQAPTSWYEKTPSGRILSRFSGDLTMVDKMMAYILDDLIQFSLLILTLLITISVLVPEITPILLIGIFVYGFTLLAVDRTNRQAKRETNAALSPVMTTMSETISGSSLIHAMNFEAFFCDRQLQNVNSWSRYNHFSCTSVQFSGLVTNVVASVFTISAALIVYVKRESYPDVTYVGIALNYSFLVPYFLGVYSMLVMFLATSATSLERVLDFVTGDIPQEPPWTLPNDPDPKHWPSKGNVVFDNVSMRYRPGLPLALQNVSFDIAGGEKIGVVGRTGAGKSTLIVLLFRIVDKIENGGKIFLDGIDMSTIGIHTARRALAIIPQTPLLIPGTVGHNLDPFDTKSQQQMENALEKVGLNIDTFHSKAKSLSAGEQQLLALARLLLRDEEGDGEEEFPKVVIMDEPTANIDRQTDENIQRVIEEEFSSDKHNVTMFTIAHRLNTVIASDRMMVMSNGSIGEFDQPHNLFQNEGGMLSNMVKAIGEEGATSLKHSAAVAAKKTQ